MALICATVPWEWVRFNFRAGAWRPRGAPLHYPGATSTWMITGRQAVQEPGLSSCYRARLLFLAQSLGSNVSSIVDYDRLVVVRSREALGSIQSLFERHDES